MSEDRQFRLGGFEILIVNDGSTDATPEVLDGLQRGRIPSSREVRLRTNVGQSGATAAGFRAAEGTWIATLDADLQNDPPTWHLWRMLPGHDVALGWRDQRRDAWFRRLVSRWANRVRNAVLGQSIRDTGCSVRIFPRELALRLPLFHGSHRFLGPLLIREGAGSSSRP